MQKSMITRWSLKGSAAVLALAGAFTAAQAYETKFGEVSITFDTTVSMGSSIRTAERNEEFLSESNGGSRVDLRPLSNGTVGNTAFALLGVVAPAPTNVASLASATNREGSVNSDDGRLNYDRGDIFSANVKANHDLQVSWQNYRIFARGVEFYDVIQNDAGHTERSDLSDSTRGLVGRSAKLLDAFISADYDVSGLPLNVRVGKQVISWGESTFIQNGINTVNPIDVAAFRRPGAEIKEGLLPVNSLFASFGLFPNASLSAYYMLDFEPYLIDAPGTAFSGADVLDLRNQDPNGNFNGNSFISGGKYSGTFRRNCNTPTVINVGAASPTTTFVAAANGASGARQIAGLFGSGVTYDAVIHAHCLGGDDIVDYNFQIPTGQLEFYKNTTPGSAATPEESIVGRDSNRDARDDGQYGLRFNWLAEDLGGTEFGFYFQNYHSRLPFVSFHSNSPRVGISTIAPNASATGRGTLLGGCITNGDSSAGLLVGAPGNNGYLQTGNAKEFYKTAGGFQLAELALFQQTMAADPNNYEGEMAKVAAGIANLQAGAAAAGAAADAAAAGLLLPGPAQTALLASAAAKAALAGQWASEAGGIIAQAGVSATQANFSNLSRINCLVAAGSAVGSILADGTELLGAINDMDLFIEYPEDIQSWGFSFNTVIAGWGVQGEFSYRPNAPFQLDTDQLTIASAISQCAGWGVGTAGIAFQLINTMKDTNCPYNDDLTQTAAEKAAAGLAPGNQDVTGYVRNKMYTAQIGTTSTFTASEWFIDGVGADLGVLVTEVGMVYVPDVEDTWINGLASPALAGPQYASTGCQGSDLPLGGFLDVRVAKSAQCRPTDLSAGLVMLYRLEYNNAFDSGFQIAPTLTYSWDFEGTTPAPYGNFMEDRQALGLNVTGTLNNNFKVGAGYTGYFGGHINNKSRDQDFASITASYSF